MSNDAEVRARAFDAALDLKLRLAAKGIDLTDDARTVINRAFLAFAAEARSHDGEWEAIETAPKTHGAPILSTNRFGVVDTICWNDSTGGWDDGDYREDLEPFFPTYWRPVPALPTVSAVPLFDEGRETGKLDA